MKTKTLVTAFAPFGIFKTNISQQIASKLKERGYKVVILPASHDCLDLLRQAIEKYQPKQIIMLGQGKLFGLQIESSAKIVVDNFRPRVKKYSLFATEIASDLDIKLSSDAGDYYCEYSYAQALSLMDRVCFVHIGMMSNILKTTNKIEEIIRYAEEI